MNTILLGNANPNPVILFTKLAILSTINAETEAIIKKLSGFAKFCSN